MENMANQVIGVRFEDVGKIYDFTNPSGFDVSAGDHVVVETSRGRELGWIEKMDEIPSNHAERDYKPIVRKATSHDLLLKKRHSHREAEVLKQARMAAVELGLRVKIAKAQYSFDGSRLTLYYGAEKDVDLHKLKRRLQSDLNVRPDFRRIGPRDVAKHLGGAGACGLEERCCSAFLTEFQPISIKMAKAQDLPLVPAEIAGMCGRLRCCLAYEYEYYKDASKGMPNPGQWVVSHDHSGKVLERNMIKETVTIGTDSGRVELPVEDVWVGKSGDPPIEGGCGRECSCGNKSVATGGDQ